MATSLDSLAVSVLSIRISVLSAVISWFTTRPTICSICCMKRFSSTACVAGDSGLGGGVPCRVGGRGEWSSISSFSSGSPVGISGACGVTLNPSLSSESGSFTVHALISSVDSGAAGLGVLGRVGWAGVWVRVAVGVAGLLALGARGVGVRESGEPRAPDVGKRFLSRGSPPVAAHCDSCRRFGFAV